MDASVSAESAILYNPGSKTVIFEKEADKKRGIASTTKIMTALIALELYPLDMEVEILPQWCGIEGSSMYLSPGERLTVFDLLCGLMLMSGNDAAVALASIGQKDTSHFVALMNEKAQALSMDDTSFENPSGLDGENHYSTAYDMALLASYAMGVDAFREIAGLQSATVAGRYMKNHNKLLRTLNGATGIKTGFTKSSGRCLVSSMMQNGRELIAVTLNAPSDWQDHKSLYEQAFSAFAHTVLVTAGTLAEIPVVSGEKKAVSLYAEADFSYFIADYELDALTVSVCGDRFAYAPVQKGAQYGTVEVKLGQTLIYTAPVFYADTVDAVLSPAGFFDKIVDVFSRWF